MKRLLLALVLCLLVGVVGATSLNFQTDQTSYMTSGQYCPFGSPSTSSQSWIRSEVGENSYVKISGSACGGGTSTNDAVFVYNAGPLITTYAAATRLNINNVPPFIVLYDSSKNVLYRYITVTGDASTARFEVYLTGGKAYIYRNGLQIAVSGTLAVNPSYVGFGQSTNGGIGLVYWDDFVYGTTENRYVFGNPEVNTYILIKDMITPASSGAAFSNNHTVVSANNMTTTWGKSNISYSGNETIVLQNVDTGIIYGTRYTNTASYGTASWSLVDEIFNSGSTYGRYYVTIPSTGSYSEEIWYIGSGATISFDEDTYSGQDTATMTYNILGAYWDTSTYSYSIDVVSGTTGATMQSTAISASSGTDTYTFTSTDPLGVYYAIVKATKHSDGSVIWMNYDYAELASYVTIEGYVNDAETGLPISGANINITQSSTINNLTTIADGNYSATYYLSGAPITINATAPLHRQYTYTFTPLIAKTIDLNISLINTTPTVAGLGIGGVARDTAYGRPLASVGVWLINTTNAETNTKSTSMTWWYLCDEGTTCFLTTARPYDVWGEKPGYSNSANYTAVTA